MTFSNYGVYISTCISFLFFFAKTTKICLIIPTVPNNSELRKVAQQKANIASKKISNIGVDGGGQLLLP